MAAEEREKMQSVAMTDRPTGMQDKSKSFSLSYYCNVLGAVIKRPSAFFDGLPDDIGFVRPLSVLAVSGIFCALASLMQIQVNRTLMFSIILANAVLLPIISAGLGYALAGPMMNMKAGFPKFLAVYAFSSAAVLLVAWIPSLIFMTEPYKWFLIGKGLVRSIGLTKVQAILLILFSICVMMLVYWLLASVVRKTI